MRALPFVALLLSGCCESMYHGDPHSGLDGKRMGARHAILGRIYHDRVSYPDQGRTDWRYVDVYGRGKLAVELTRDNEEVRLALDVFDRVGVSVARTMTTNANPLYWQTTLPEAGRYYIRVKTAGGHRDATTYDIRILFSDTHL